MVVGVLAIMAILILRLGMKGGASKAFDIAPRIPGSCHVMALMSLLFVLIFVVSVLVLALVLVLILLVLFLG